MSVPMIALVGRPNVGKSRLFNRLVGRRAAIVENIPGVTRDRHYGLAQWGTRSFYVIDTGGFDPESEDLLLEQMRTQALLAIEEADLVLMLVDGRDGCLPTDASIAAILRKSTKPIIIVVNKLDQPEMFVHISDFYTLGFSDILPLSAEHGLGMDALMDLVLNYLPQAELHSEDLEEQTRIKVAVVGKPNVGKSTLINRLLGSDRLLTSDIPGTTRDAIDTLITFEHRDYLFIDTAGLRRKKNIALKLEKFSVVRAIRSLEQADVVLLLIDVQLGVTDQDARIAQLAHDRGKALILILNKWDTIDKDQTHEARKAFELRLKDKLSFCDYAPILTISAKTGLRTHRIFKTIQKVYDTAGKRLPTGELNRVIRDILHKHQAPMVGTRRAKFYYFAQVGTHPPTFVFKVNDPKLVHRSYRKFIENQLRQYYPFPGTPLRIFFRKPKDRHRWRSLDL